ncbi:hypothetical protein MUN78_10180 [Leucobacter allii]|uniref:Uncharacterized protein n=1 Tax=Leucobacter allii TaxID=2932247 RepID=A0ABY4FIZ3_9MICO|nr:hypothetical protein [Leucobacter allii]UOQ56071.1 hypothetical protein MUN78_10180 [Leucobacter allii]
MTVLDISDFAAHLPRGGAVAQWDGGWGAITAEEEALRRVEWAIVAVNSKKRPPLPKPPVSVRETERRIAKQKARQDRLRTQFKDWRK